jgi:branched-chain amino acid transport system substrate-binding protein
MIMRRSVWKVLGCVLLIALVSSIFFTGGCSPKDSALSGNPIVIGGALSTGFLYGWDAERGIKLAADEINAAGGVNVGGEMRPLKVEIMDTRDLEPGVPVSDALLAVEKLILEKKADFLIGGPIRSEAALAAMDLMSRHEKVAIFTTGFLSGAFKQYLTDDYEKYKYSFRISGSAPNMVGEMLAVFDSLKDDFGFDKVAVMVQDVAHARAGGDIMAEQLKNRGWNVIGPEIYPTGTLDFSDGLLKARNHGSQVLFIWMDMPESVILLKHYREMELPALPIGFMSAAEQPGFWDATDGDGEFAVAHLVNAGNAPVEATELTMDFARAYEKKWGLEPEGYGTSSSYQAVYTLVDAIERAGTIDSDAVIAALKETDMMGVYGRIRFDEQHQVIPSLDPAEGATPQIIQWLDGKRETVFPPSIATSPFKLPPWMQ